MATLLHLFQMRFAPSATPRCRSLRNHVPPVAGTTRDCLVAHPTANPLASSLILKVIICLNAVRNSENKGNNLAETKSTILGGVHYNVSTRVETDDEANVENVDPSVKEVNETKDTSGKCDASSVANEYDDDEWLGPKQSPLVEPVKFDPKPQSKFMPEELQNEKCRDTEMGDPIPTEYNPEKRHELPTNERMVSDGTPTVDCDDSDYQEEEDERGSDQGYSSSISENDTGSESDTAASHSTQSVKSYPRLTESKLTAHTKYIKELEGYHNYIPQGPYPFMTNPNHLAPEFVTRQDRDGLGLFCPDGCVDCEVLPSEVMRSKRNVDRWFNKYFTFQNLHLAIWVDPEQHAKRRTACSEHEFSGVEYGDEEEEDNIDFLYGATESDEFNLLKKLHDRRESSAMTKQDLVTCHMMHADFATCSVIPYFHGRRYNVIVAEYEPKYLPNIVYTHDNKEYTSVRYERDHRRLNRPVWEARGGIAPGDAEEERMEYMRKEHRRQWLMYRSQDNARRRYVAEVMKDASEEYARTYQGKA